MNLQITVVSDIICPWCFVGKRRLELAIKSLGLESSVGLSLAPHQLYPDIPLEGKDRKEFRNKGIGSLLQAAGEQIGIEFRWDLIKRIPNTLECHRRLMQVPNTQSRWNAKEALLQAYFCEGADLTDEGQLDAIMAPFEDLEATSISEKDIQALLQSSRDRGITAVPTFIIDGEHQLTGAMEQSQWTQFLKRRFSKS